MVNEVKMQKHWYSPLKKTAQAFADSRVMDAHRKPEMVPLIQLFIQLF